jgi:hypothetical protein
MRTAQVVYSTARFSAMLGSVVVWLFGTLSCMYFLGWFISSPEGDPSPDISPTAVWVVAGIALVDVLLCLAARKPSGSAVVRVSVIGVVVLALAGLLVRLPETVGALPVSFVVLSFLVPTLAYALVLPAAIIGWRDVRAGARTMAGITVAFLAGFGVQSISDAKLWISFTDVGGALATGVLVLLLFGARATEAKTSTRPAESLETTPPRSGPRAD